jgi:putative Holliday junction resolvase
VEQVRVLGIDYGTRNLGFAVSDELAMVAREIGSCKYINDQQLISEIGGLIRLYEAKKVVLGYPLREDGTPGSLCPHIDRLAALLTEQLGIEVVKWDETLTTCGAEEILSQRGYDWRQRKKHVDKIAAALLLQDYLDRQGDQMVEARGKW